MESEGSEKKQPAPYISWKTFTAFIGNMRGRLPVQIDASVLPSMSGTARSHLLSALRFLELIDTDGTVKDSLRELTDAYNTESWKPQLRKMISSAYGRVLGDLDVATATPAMLRDRFKNFGNVQSGTIDLALRFYVSAIKEAEIPYSPHLIVRQRAPRNSSVRKRAIQKSSEPQEEAEEFEIPDGTFEVSLAMLGVGGKLLLPEDLSLNQWDAISDFVKTVIDLRQRAQRKE